MCVQWKCCDETTGVSSSWDVWMYDWMDCRESESSDEAGFYAISQISPYIETFVGTVMRMSSVCECGVSIACLQFVESLVYYDVYMYLRLKGGRDVLDVENVKTRDVELMRNGVVLEECGVKDVVHLLSDEALNVLRRNGDESKPSLAKKRIGYAVRVAIVYGKERESKLSVLVEV